MPDELTRQDRPAAPTAPEATRTAPTFTPVTDIYETGDGLVLLLEMPGVGPDAVDITLDNRVLTVRGRSAFAPPQGYSLAHAEYRVGDYERAFTVSEAIDRERIGAAMKNGVLRLTLPKAAPAPARTISVQAG